MQTDRPIGVRGGVKKKQGGLDRQAEEQAATFLGLASGDVSTVTTAERDPTAAQALFASGLEAAVRTLVNSGLQQQPQAQATSPPQPHLLLPQAFGLGSGLPDLGLDSGTGDDSATEAEGEAELPPAASFCPFPVPDRSSRSQIPGVPHVLDRSSRSQIPDVPLVKPEEGVMGEEEEGQGQQEGDERDHDDDPMGMVDPLVDPLEAPMMDPMGCEADAVVHLHTRGGSGNGSSSLDAPKGEQDVGYGSGPEMRCSSAGWRCAVKQEQAEQEQQLGLQEGGAASSPPAKAGSLPLPMPAPELCGYPDGQHLPAFQEPDMGQEPELTQEQEDVMYSTPTRSRPSGNDAGAAAPAVGAASPFSRRSGASERAGSVEPEADADADLCRVSSGSCASASGLVTASSTCGSELPFGPAVTGAAASLSLSQSQSLSHAPSLSQSQSQSQSHSYCASQPSLPPLPSLPLPHPPHPSYTYPYPHHHPSRYPQYSSSSMHGCHYPPGHSLATLYPPPPYPVHGMRASAPSSASGGPSYPNSALHAPPPHPSSSYGAHPSSQPWPAPPPSYGHSAPYSYKPAGPYGYPPSWPDMGPQGYYHPTSRPQAPHTHSYYHSVPPSSHYQHAPSYPSALPPPHTHIGPGSYPPAGPYPTSRLPPLPPLPTARHMGASAVAQAPAQPAAVHATADAGVCAPSLCFAGSDALGAPGGELEELDGLTLSGLLSDLDCDDAGEDEVLQHVVGGGVGAGVQHEGIDQELVAWLG